MTFVERLRTAREAAMGVEDLDFDDFEHEFYAEPTGEHTQRCQGCRDYEAALDIRVALSSLLVDNAEKIERLIEAAQRYTQYTDRERPVIVAGKFHLALDKLNRDGNA